MYFDEITKVGLDGLEVLPSITPEVLKSKMDEFVNKCVRLLVSEVNRSKKLDVVFPMNGGLMFLYLIQKSLPSEYHNCVNFVSAYRSDPNDKTKYKFVHSKGSFFGTPIIIDDMWDSGESTEHVSKAIAEEIGTETMGSLSSPSEEDLYTESLGDVPIPVLVATTKEGKICSSATFEYGKRGESDDWIASGFGLNCGKGPASTSRYERLAGISYAVTNLDSYIKTVSDDSNRATYERILEESGRECYGADYDTMMNLLEVMDNDELDTDLRCLSVLVELGLIVEA